MTPSGRFFSKKTDEIFGRSRLPLVAGIVPFRSEYYEVLPIFASRTCTKDQSSEYVGAISEAIAKHLATASGI
jgi:hypothetical protein